MQGQTTGRQLQALIEQTARLRRRACCWPYTRLCKAWTGLARPGGIRLKMANSSVRSGFSHRQHEQNLYRGAGSPTAGAGELALSDPISNYLPQDIAKLIPVADGHLVSDITVEHLLRHRAGFNDFALSQEWLMEIAADPGRARTPEEIIRWACAHTSLVGAPGENYTYSDTGYVLLGILLENISGAPTGSCAVNASSTPWRWEKPGSRAMKNHVTRCHTPTL